MADLSLTEWHKLNRGHGAPDAWEHIFYLGKRPSRLRRIINWVLRRPGSGFKGITATLQLDYNRPVGVAIDDSTILFQPTYNFPDDLEVKLYVAEDDTDED